MNERLLPIRFAPLQGYTDAVYRQAYNRLFGGDISAYYAPFARVERGEVRRKDIRDIEMENNPNMHLIPQLIAPDIEKAEQIASLFIQKGNPEININLGCPFPALAKRHNGAGMLPYPEEVAYMLSCLVENHPDTRFSVKLRLGWDDPEECLRLLPLFNQLPLSHIILHPRLGKQQYNGNVDLKTFTAFYKECEVPLFYNGDLQTPEHIRAISRLYPRLAGVVIGRGLLANPALVMEYRQGKPLPPSEKARMVGEMHSEVFNVYQNSLQGGETQLLMKMKSFWEYLLPDGDRKARKIIHKTTKLANYLAAVSNLLGSYREDVPTPNLMLN